MEEFCQKCESVLPIDSPECTCGHEVDVDLPPSTIRIWFNKRDKTVQQEIKSEGPIVDKFCERCSRITEQSYSTLQLRSADEGQTVFYKCTVCLTKKNENS